MTPLQPDEFDPDGPSVDMVAEGFAPPPEWEPTTDDDIPPAAYGALSDLYKVARESDAGAASMLVFDKADRYIGSTSVARLATGVWTGVVVRAVQGEEASIIIATGPIERES